MSEERKHDEEGEAGKSYKVSDRRRFTETEPAPATDGAPSPTAEAPHPHAAPASESGARRAPLPPMDFSNLIISLATQGLVALGQVSLSEEERPAVDLDAASQIIDTLAMLEVKTKGNLTPDETSLLRGMLFELRMHFVRETNRRKQEGT